MSTHHLKLTTQKPINVCYGSHSLGNIIFQDISRTKLPFSRTNYTRFKGNKSWNMWKSISYLSNVWSVIDIFMVQPPHHPLLTVWSTHFYIITNMGYQDYVPVLFFSLYSNFSSTDTIFIQRPFCSKWIFSQAIFFQDISWFCHIQGHFQDIPGCVETLACLWMWWELYPAKL